MAFTLIELERTHNCPMIVRDVFTHNWYVILRPEQPGSTIYEAKPLLPNGDTIPVHEPIVAIYGGYTRWVFISKPKHTELSPEDQKRIKQEERKKNNDKIIRDLKRSKGSRMTTPPPKPKVPSSSADKGQVIPFKPKPKD